MNNLAQASEILTQANEVTTYYEEELSRVRKEGQLLVTEAQKIHKEILDLELETSQSYLDKLLDTIIEDLMDKQKVALSSLDTIVQSLCVEVENQLY